MQGLEQPFEEGQLQGQTGPAACPERTSRTTPAAELGQVHLHGQGVNPLAVEIGIDPVAIYSDLGRRENDRVVVAHNSLIPLI